MINILYKIVAIEVHLIMHTSDINIINVILRIHYTVDIKAFHTLLFSNVKGSSLKLVTLLVLFVIKYRISVFFALERFSP